MGLRACGGGSCRQLCILRFCTWALLLSATLLLLLPTLRCCCALAHCVWYMAAWSRRHHHKYPMDFDRLVFPPAIAAVVIALFHALLHQLLPLVSWVAAISDSCCRWLDWLAI